MWLDFIINYLMFLLKVGTLLIALLIFLAFILRAKKNNNKENGSIKMVDISSKLQKQQQELLEKTMDSNQLKEYRKQQKHKTDDSLEEEKEEEDASRLFVIEFDGNVTADAVDCLREEITAILMLATTKDQVLLKLESPGGSVNGYGLAAAQLQRLKDKGIFLTVAVDKVAASGGYLMACVANRIIASPFSILGSIGVVAQIPNIHRLLKKHDVDVDVLTAGKYKRTLTLLGENNQEGREKFQEQLTDIHISFKDFVSKHRPTLDIEEVATGEYWLGEKALELQLVDEILTSDDFILNAVEKGSVYSLEYEFKESLSDKISSRLSLSIRHLIKELLSNSFFTI